MSENIITNVEQNANESNQEITVREILEKIEKLQDQLASLKETGNALMAIDDTDEFDGPHLSESVNEEMVLAKIDAIKQVFFEREKTLNSLLDFYKDMYNDLYQEKKRKMQSENETEAQIKRREEFLNFVTKTTASAPAGAFIPNFEEIWKTVYLGQ